MGIPFTVVQGLVAIFDTAGNIVETISSAAKRRLAAQSVVAGGNSPYRETDVVVGPDSRNRFCVDAIFSADAQPQALQYINKNYRIVWNNTEVTIPASATYTTAFSITGKGYFFGFHIDMDKESVDVKIVVDGVTILEGATLKFIKDLGFVLGGSVPVQYQNKEVWVSSGADMDFSPPFAIYYTSSFEVLHRSTADNFKRSRFMYHYSIG